MRSGFQAKAQMKMQTSRLSPKGSRSAREPKRRRIAVITSLLLFVFQLSLSLLLHPINQILCLEELSGSPTAVGHDHHHDAGVLAHSDSDPASNSVQHCKDTVFGVAVTPMQPFSLPSAVSPQALTTTWASPWADFQPIFGRALPPPYQPPRA
jgi:hypothetical protein